MEQIRAFIAIQLPTQVRKKLDDFIQHLAPQVPRGSVRWVKPEAMHLTLRFLGDTDVALLSRVQAAMDSASMQEPFELLVEGFGCFPDCRRPRVLWSGVAGDITAVRALKQQLDVKLAPLGWPPEDRDFAPHLTLGRVKESWSWSGLQWPASTAPLTLPVGSIHLIRSELLPEGPRYTVLHSSALGAG